MTHRLFTLMLIAATAVAGCNVGPPYQRPAMPEPAPAQYKENQPGNAEAQAAGWRAANPQDAMVRGNWWEVFGDPELNALEEQLNINDQTIKQAFENYMAALAVIAESRATLYPTASVTAGATVSGSTGSTTSTGTPTSPGTGGGTTPPSRERDELISGAGTRLSSATPCGRDGSIGGRFRSGGGLPSAIAGLSARLDGPP